MSEILIRGIELPKPGQTIEIAANWDGSLYARLSPSFGSWHQIIELPPHGRLIDADVYEYPGDLADEPTIISASKMG